MAKNSLRPVIVSDSGPLIHLDELESLELLADFSVWVPKKVEEEVANYRPDIFQRFQSFLIQRDIPPRLPPNLYQLAKALSLGPGEISALSLMEDNPAAIFLTDDAAARLAAQILGYRAHGSIGILLRSIRTNRLSIPEVIERLEAIPQKSSLHIRPTLLREIIDRLLKENAGSFR